MKWRSQNASGFRQVDQEYEQWDMDLSAWCELWEQVLSGLAWSG